MPKLIFPHCSCVEILREAVSSSWTGSSLLSPQWGYERLWNFFLNFSTADELSRPRELNAVRLDGVVLYKTSVLSIFLPPAVRLWSEMCWCCLFALLSSPDKWKDGNVVECSSCSVYYLPKHLSSFFFPSPSSSLSYTQKTSMNFSLTGSWRLPPFIIPPSHTRKTHFACLSRSAGHIQVSLCRFIAFLPLSTAL